MKRNLAIFFWAISVLLFTVVSSPAAVVVGDQAPEFTAQDTKGTEHVLSAYKDKFVVLEWFNPDCPFVKKHYGSGNMQRLQKMYTQKGVVWLSLCSSAEGKQGYYGPEEMNRQMDEKGASPTAVILDPDGTIGRMYGAATTPHIFIIDPQGKLIYQGAIDDVPGTDLAEIEGAENYVEKALNAAMNGEPVEVPSTKSYGCSVKY